MPTEEEVLASQAIVESVFRSFQDRLLAVFGTIEFTRKGDMSPVTVWDKAIEHELQNSLSETFPHLGFEGEETGHKGNEITYWLVDPIDGTSSFIRGLPYATNMAALVHDGVVLAAVIYDFVHGDVFTAMKGHGAYKNGQRISVNAERRTHDLVVYVMTRKQFPLIREALQELGMRTVQPMGAAGHAYSLLAEGKIDGIVNIHTTMGTYDNAPGVLLAVEAGAVLVPYDDQTGVYRHEFVIGSPFVADTIQQSGLL